MKILPLLFIFASAFCIAQTPPGNCDASASQSASWHEVLRCRKILQIEAASKFFNADAMARELLKIPEFQNLGYQTIRHTVDNPHSVDRRNPANKDAMLLRVTRKPFTTRFTVTLEDPASHRLFVSAEANSIGGTIEPKLAKQVVKWIVEANGKP